MAYEVVMSYHLHMPSYFLGTFTEYPYLHYAVAERWIHSVESRELKVTVWHYNADCFQLSTLNFLIAFSVYLD